ncbi:MAG: aminoacyl-tRNA hydrolase [Myxococcales bacterium]|nr:aminoacyl-tRNA hydrolase [Myxococcales bacterium]MCB9577137.1 aminoacyl-tRNA hydrolase [Polyangiaceae bacterium]
MILVVGLGNPGPRYASTRHNIGFAVAEKLVELGGGAFRSRFHGRLADVMLDSRRVLVLQPETYMNESGRSVRATMDYFKLDSADLVVVHDELDLALGTLRLKQGGGDAGHRGLRSISQELGTSDYARLRFGIGRPEQNFGGTVADFVLEGFPLADRPQVQEHVERAAKALVLFVREGREAAMNVINRRA